MFDDLLRAALEDLPPQVDHLILVPDGALHQLPFPMLSNGDRPLVSRYRLSTVPSATLWLTWRQRPGLASSQQALARDRHVGPRLLERHANDGLRGTAVWPAICEL